MLFMTEYGIIYFSLSLYGDTKQLTLTFSVKSLKVYDFMALSVSAIWGILTVI